MVQQESVIILRRCANCNRLANSIDVLKQGQCSCGSAKFYGASPANLFEELLVQWWVIKLFIKLNFRRNNA